MRKVTMSDVAQAAGVSKQTVSRVINAKGKISKGTTARVQEVIQQLGYKPNGVARSLVTRQTRTLGLVVPNLSNPFFSEIAEGAEMAAWEQGYSLFLSNVFSDPEHEEVALDTFEQRGVDGIIIVKSSLPDKKLLPLLRRQRAAIVVHRTVPSEAAGTIQIDYVSSTRLAVQHLLQTGRRTLGLLPGQLRSGNSQARLQGFMSAMAEAGHEVNKELIVQCSTNLESAVEAVTQLISKHPELDGFVCYHDVVAIGALQACRELGVQVPGDVAVIGHHDIEIAKFVTPQLTTLRVNRFEIGMNALRMLLDRIHGRNKNVEIVVKPELVVRESAPYQEFRRDGMPNEEMLER